MKNISSKVNNLIVLRDLKINYLTVHISSGLAALKAVKKISGSTKIIGVTTLTSLNNKLANSIPGFYEIFDTLMAADLAVRELTRDLGASGGQAEAL